MKTNSSAEDAALGKALRDWKVEASLPPRFNEQVWRRIARAESRPTSRWFLFRDWIAQTFARPALAVSYVTVLLAIGLTVGYWQAQSGNARAMETLSSSYIQMLDPFQMPRH